MQVFAGKDVMSVKYEKNKDNSIQKIRFAVQTAFALLCLWIGIEFSQFIKYLETEGHAGSFSRPPGVEGFLPISALMNVVYFFRTGNINDVHPAGFFIFAAIVGVSLLFGKSFCSWLCPVGFISEMVGDFGDKIWKKLFKKRFKLPKILDYPLRGVKYLLLVFFTYAIFSMSVVSLEYFLNGPYNISADIKMWYFFANISNFSLIVISVFFVLSIFIRNFWCRYLCPYGALLGVVGLLSPNKIKRNTASCIDCGLCAKACPSFIKVDKVITVRSDECSTCMSCVDVCPVADTLDVRTSFTKKKFSKKIITLAVVVVFMLITGAGMLTGYWHNKVSKEDYFAVHKNLDAIGHPTSAEEIKALNKLSEKNNSKEKTN
jgi:polyferredoxin